MANIMSMKSVKNRPTRSGYDLSRRTCFTAKVGELLPIWWNYVLPHVVVSLARQLEE